MYKRQTVGRDYNTGDPIIIKVYGTTIEELENKKAMVKSDYLKGNNIITRKVIFHDYAQRWLESKKLYIAQMCIRDSAVHPAPCVSYPYHQPLR